MPIAVIYIASAMLILGAAPLPYGYYTLLRIVAFIVFIWAAYAAHKAKSLVLPLVFVLLAILFNPIIKIYFPKELWIAIDLFSGFLLLVTRQKIQARKENDVIV